MEFTVVNTLIAITFILLVSVTGGIAYLTAVEWRDRRRRDQEKRANRTPSRR